MRALILIGAVLFGPSLVLPARGDVVVTSPAAGRLVIEMTFAEPSLARRDDGTSAVVLEDCHPFNDPAYPALPVRTFRVALPDGMQAVKAGLSHATYIPVEGRHRIAPLPPPRTIGGQDIGAARPSSRRDPAVIPPIALLGQADLAGQSFATLRACPARYAPGTGGLELATAMRFELVCAPGYACGDYLPESASGRSREVYARTLRGMVVNPDDVTLRCGTPDRPYHRGVGPGRFDYVIITSVAWVDYFRELAAWRTRQGIPTTIVTTDWIRGEGGYPGGDATKHRNFIKDAHANWGATTFLLGGDSDIVLCQWRPIEIPEFGTDYVANDTFYADFDHDFVAEVTVARAWPRMHLEVPVFISKTLSYEKDPPADYATTAAFFGFDISEVGDAEGEIAKEKIRERHLPESWTLRTEYDSEYGHHKADVLGYLEQGNHLVNHFDHCNRDVMGVGWTCHRQLIERSDLTALTNGDRQSIMLSVGCFTGHFPAPTCISEAYLRNPDGGGVAFLGNTSYGWTGPPENSDVYVVRQDRLFFKNLFDDGIYYLGENFTDLKNDEYDADDPYNLHAHAFTEFHLLGEPFLPVWTEDPRTLSVAHPESAAVGAPSAFSVQVSDERTPLDGATVCLWKGDEVYLVEETSGGLAAFEFTASAPGTLLVTATCRNHLAYEGQAIVAPRVANVQTSHDELPDRPAVHAATPNPFRARTELSFAVPGGGADRPVRLAIYDCSGRLVRTLVEGSRTPGPHQVDWDGRDDRGLQVATGVYFCELLCGDDRATRKLALLR